MNSVVYMLLGLSIIPIVEIAFLVGYLVSSHSHRRDNIPEIMSTQSLRFNRIPGTVPALVYDSNTLAVYEVITYHDTQTSKGYIVEYVPYISTTGHFCMYIDHQITDVASLSS